MKEAWLPASGLNAEDLPYPLCPKMAAKNWRSALMECILKALHSSARIVDAASPPRLSEKALHVRTTARKP